jgi:hypothetical protein
MSHVAIHAAAEKQKQRRWEEEDMTRYSQEELENEWELKILRSTTGAFKKLETFAKVLEEESIAGWDMVEKFDNNRIRFKRPKSARTRDAMLPKSARTRDAMLPPGIDPYRTQYGIDEGTLAVTIITVVVLIGGLVALLVYLFNL